MNVMVFDGAAIRQARKARGLTLDALASMLGASKFALSRWENGKARPNDEAARKLADWLQPDLKHDRMQGSVEPFRFGSNGMTVQEWRAATQPIEIKVSQKLKEGAADLGLDLLQLFETVGAQAVRKALDEEWKRQNAEAIRHNNEIIEREGLPFAEFRRF